MNNNNLYPNINPTERTWKKRAQIKSLLDSFCTFNWNNYSGFDSFGAFIIGGNDSLKFFNGPSFSNEYVTPQFDGANSILTGVKFSQQKISFNVGIYWIREEDYRLLLNWLHPYEVGFLSFGFEPKWEYRVKLTGVNDSNRYVVGQDYGLDGKTQNVSYKLTWNKEEATAILTYDIVNKPIASLESITLKTGKSQKAISLSTKNAEVSGDVLVYKFTNIDIETEADNTWKYDLIFNYNNKYTSQENSELVLEHKGFLAENAIFNDLWTLDEYAINTNVYYSELKLTFEVQGRSCAQGITPYSFNITQKQITSSNKNIINPLYVCSLKSEDFIKSDLNTPFKLTFSLSPKIKTKSTTVSNVLISLTATLRRGGSQDSIIFELFKLSLQNLSSFSIMDKANESNLNKIFLTYDSESGLVFWSFGNQQEKILSLMSSADTGARIVEYMNIKKGFLPGRFDFPSVDLLNQFDLSLEIENDADWTIDADSIQIISYPLTNII